ncbi:hypothetical protein LTR56_011436 [Elasticomyces elasticus]|nr:hypothetical protein LTR56_011436 [Elasticomyces elasticus]KAK5760059.1 hypothetical protein LTS12_009790 [Elasticomyces elasticus]
MSVDPSQGYLPDFQDDKMIQPTAYQGTNAQRPSTHDGSFHAKAAALRNFPERRENGVCDHDFTDPLSYQNSGATAFLDSFLTANGTDNWLQNMNKATTQGFQPIPIDCESLESSSCQPTDPCTIFTPPQFFFVRLAAANAQSYFRALSELVQDLAIEQSLQIGQLVSDFGPSQDADKSSSLLGDILKIISPQLSIGDKVVKQSKGLGKLADSLGFIGAAINLAAGVIALGGANPANSPSFNDLVNVADAALESTFNATQVAIHSLNSKLMGGSPDPEYATPKHIPNKKSGDDPAWRRTTRRIDLGQVVSSLIVTSANDPSGLAAGDQLAVNQIAQIFGPGFFMLPLDQVLTADVNNTAQSGFEAGVQLVRQQTVMAVLAAQNYFVFLNTHRDADACNSITGSRFINNQCFTIEQPTPNVVNCQQDSVIIDKDIVLKLDDPSKPYGFDLNAFYSNVQACNNGQPDTSLDITDDLPPCAFGIPFVCGMNHEYHMAADSLSRSPRPKAFAMLRAAFRQIYNYLVRPRRYVLILALAERATLSVERDPRRSGFQLNFL